MDAAEAMFWAIIPALSKFASGFALGWFVCYALLCTTVKYFAIIYNFSGNRLVLLAGIFILNILFSLILANPWILFWIIAYFSLYLGLDTIGYLLALSLIFWILSFLVDVAVIKIVSKTRHLKHFKLSLSLKRLLLANFCVVVIAMTAGYIGGKILMAS